MTVNILEAKNCITDTLRAGLVPNLLGSPGVGKSDIVRVVAEDLNLKVIDFRLAQADPTDMMGFPTLNKDRTRSHYAAPANFPLETDTVPEGHNGWLLFFDEMNSAAPSVQAAAYKVILDRMVGENNLHKKVAMVCAGNLTTDKAITNRLSTAMQSRLIHFTLDVNNKEWLDWAIAQDIDYRVVGFIRFRPELLHNFKANHNDTTFPCPRTWHFLSRLVKHLQVISKDKIPLLEGTVGVGAGREFKGFCDIFESLPTLNELINSPQTVTIPEEPSTLYAITALISNKADKQNISSFMEFLNRLPIEFQTLTLQGIVRKHKEILKEPLIKAWIAINANELL